MKEQLIGYLLDALDPEEQRQVEAQLDRDPQLKRNLDLLSRSLWPLAADKERYEPPSGLAERTCLFVTRRAVQVSPPSAPPVYGRRQWSLADMVVAAGIFIAAAMLFFPAVRQSRFAARVTQCQDNLRQVGMGLYNYSDRHGGFYPNVPLDGNCAAAGVVAVRLHEMGFIDGPRILICPASALADSAADFHVPTLAELRAAHGAQLVRMQRQMGGSLGFNIGYMANGRYCSPKNLHRTRYALVADAPSLEAPYHSINHGGCGQNVLFEDQHVQYLTTCRARGCRDDFYTNDHGLVRPGLHVHDAVIGPSHTRPQLEIVLIEIRSTDDQ